MYTTHTHCSIDMNIVQGVDLEMRWDGMLKTDKASIMNIKGRRIHVSNSITASGHGQEAEAIVNLPEHTEHHSRMKGIGQGHQTVIIIRRKPMCLY